jgi:hypothetical protein
LGKAVKENLRRATTVGRSFFNKELTIALMP